jgi:MYXO-CTERM domain-containing protein
MFNGYFDVALANQDLSRTVAPHGKRTSVIAGALGLIAFAGLFVRRKLR